MIELQHFTLGYLINMLLLLEKKM